MTTPHINSIGRSPLRYGFLLIALACSALRFVRIKLRTKTLLYDRPRAVLALLLCVFYGIFPANSPAAPQPDRAQAGKIAFIGFDDTGSQLGPMMQPILDAQKMLWPSRKPISFQFLHFGAAAEDTAALNALINQVEALVLQLKKQGYDKIVLPDRSTFLGPFILGTGGSLTQPINVRHPNVVFGTVCPGTSAVDEAPNVFRFCDTKVDFLGNLGSMVGAGGKILVCSKPAMPRPIACARPCSFARQN